VASGKLGAIEFKMNECFSQLKFFVTGTHPKTNIFHPQWIMDRSLLRLARIFLKDIPRQSRILDVGCGHGPYWDLNRELQWTGLDVVKTARTNDVVFPGSKFPYPDDSFDAVLCTQVLEHVENPDFLVQEIDRVLKSNGSALINVPFIYPLHGLPWDYQRFTPEKFSKLLNNYRNFDVKTIGGFGSSLGTLWNNFWKDWSETSFPKRLSSLVFWPINLLGNLFFNILGLALDFLDSTEKYPLIIYGLSQESKCRTEVER
jgi:SAM-dependent methyltransferase